MTLKLQIQWRGVLKSPLILWWLSNETYLNRPPQKILFRFVSFVLVKNPVTHISHAVFSIIQHKAWYIWTQPFFHFHTWLIKLKSWVMVTSFNYLNKKTQMNIKWTSIQLIRAKTQHESPEDANRYKTFNNNSMTKKNIRNTKCSICSLIR